MNANTITSAQLRWLCRRGMKELDVMLFNFLEHHYPLSSSEQRAAFVDLLQLSDPELYDLLLGRLENHNTDVQHVLKVLRNTFTPQA